MFQIVSGLREARSDPVEAVAGAEIRSTLVRLWRDANAKSGQPTGGTAAAATPAAIEQDFGNAMVLAYADDGVIWGQIQGGDLVIARDADDRFGPELRWATLLRLHAFDDDREVRLYRSSATLSGAIAGTPTAPFVTLVLAENKSPDPNDRCFDEVQLLFGDERRYPPAMASGVTFSPIVDRAGQWHAPPLELDPPDRRTGAGHRPARLVIRHYLRPDERSGMLRLSASRILRLEAHGRSKGSSRASKGEA